MFNGQKPHHPFHRFFLYFAERRGPGCCCARADKKVGSFVRSSCYAPRNGQLGRPTRSLCSAGPESSGSIRCLLLRDLYAQQPRYMRSSHAMPCYAIGFAGLVLARSFGAQVNMIMANCQKIDPGGECGSTLLLLPLFFLPLFFLCSF